MFSSFINLFKTSKTKTLENGIVLRLNLKDCTAQIIKSPNAKGDVFIPSTVIDGSQKYSIIGIDQRDFFPNFNVKRISFSRYSEIKHLYYDHNFNCGINALPSKFEKIEFTTNSFTNFLKKLKNDAIFNCIFFANRDVNKVTIPKFITIIAPFAFHQCNNLTSIKYESDSELSLIQNGAFANSSLISISIPDNVEIIEMNAFSECKFLKTVEFGENSKLFSLGEGMFIESEIQYLIIPQHVTNIADDTFSDCPSLKCIEFLADEITISRNRIDSSIILISFPNAKKISISNLICDINDFVNIIVYACKDTHFV